jgi:ubiquinone/menaquinone biosynthesis C-methylase UbiE
MDIDIYKNPDDYQKLQLLRPDYVGALNTVLDMATVCFPPQRSIRVLDVCGGTGFISHTLTKQLSIEHVTIVDINQKLLDQSKARTWKNVEVKIICSDVMDAPIQDHSYDLILSIFAYHHIVDDEKFKFLQRIRKALSPQAFLIVAEIYLPDQEKTESYYAHLLQAVPTEKRSDEFVEFLRQTAQSEDSEFKVGKNIAEEHVQQAGFKIVQEKKIWPTDAFFPSEIGTFVQVLQVRE